MHVGCQIGLRSYMILRTWLSETVSVISDGSIYGAIVDVHSCKGALRYLFIFGMRPTPVHDQKFDKITAHCCER